jgi:hypothetical protein
VRIRQPLDKKQNKIIEHKYLTITKHFLPFTTEPRQKGLTTTPSHLSNITSNKNDTDNSKTPTNQPSTNQINNNNNINNNTPSNAVSSLNGCGDSHEEVKEKKDNLEASLTASEMYHQLPVKEGTSFLTESAIPSSAFNSLINSTLPSSQKVTPTKEELTTDLTTSVPVISHPSNVRPQPSSSLSSQKNPKSVKTIHQPRSQYTNEEDMDPNRSTLYFSQETHLNIWLSFQLRFFVVIQNVK